MSYQSHGPADCRKVNSGGWLRAPCDYDRHGLDSKPSQPILLYPWERDFTALSPAWRSWQTVLNFNNISLKLKNQINILTKQQYLGIFGSKLR